MWGKKPGPKCKNTKLNIEIYDRDRYFTVTGNVFTDPDGWTLEDLFKDDQGNLAIVYHDLFSAQSNGQANGQHVTSRHVDTSDEELLEVARKAKNGAQFTALYDRGDTSGYGNDDSSADMALMNHLAFWTGSDGDRMERLFGLSALGQRKKWTDRPDYRRHTVEAALRDCTQVYRGNGRPRTANGKAPKPARSAGPTDPITKANGEWRSCIHNSKLWLENPSRNFKIRHDTFPQNILVNDELLSDELIINLTAQIEAETRAVWTPAHTRGGVIDLACRNQFSSLTTWLDRLKWDGIGRIDDFFVDHWDCDRDDYSAACARVFFLSAVARAFKPGCQADVMVVLIGEQGLCKSTGMAALCPREEWFTDDLPDLSDRKPAECLRGKWIVEFSEFNRINRASLESVKSFLTRRVDRYRPPYDRIPKDFPRVCVFVGTTNDTRPLQDTENRRFMPLICKSKADIQKIIDAREQLWGEAVSRYRGGDKWWITDPTMLTHVAQRQELARRDDAWETILDSKLGFKNEIEIEEVMQALDIKTDRLDKPTQTRIGFCLAKLGFARVQVRVGKTRFYMWRRR
jgi:Virulence-associated protein E